MSVPVGAASLASGGRSCAREGPHSHPPLVRAPERPRAGERAFVSAITLDIDSALSGRYTAYMQYRPITPPEAKEAAPMFTIDRIRISERSHVTHTHESRQLTFVTTRRDTYGCDYQHGTYLGHYDNGKMTWVNPGLSRTAQRALAIALSQIGIAL